MPSISITVIFSTWSTDLPYLMLRVPAELLATIPPTFARFVVDTSGVNCNLCGFKKAFRWSRTTPGSTRTVRAAASKSRIRSRYLDTSTTMAAPTVCPAKLVPPPRASTGNP